MADRDLGRSVLRLTTDKSGLTSGIRAARSEAVAGVRGIQTQLNSVVAGARQQMSKLGKEGLATGIGASLTTAGIGILTGALRSIGDAAKAFREDQVSIQRLTSSLRTNIDGWDGNTRAIEKRIDASKRLGFTDDEQRESLSLLVAATNDVDKAFEIQAVAMDLARFKGISLKEATEALTKVEAGSYRILKSLGIELGENATQTDALAAVQKVAAGQAEDYANTIDGKLLAAEVKASDATEKLGKSIAQIQAVVLPAAAEAVSRFADQLDLLQVANDKAATSDDKRAAALAYVRTQGILNLPMFHKYLVMVEAEAEAADKAALYQGQHGDELAGLRSVMNNLEPKHEELNKNLAETADLAEDAERAVDDLAETVADELFGDAINAGNMAKLRETHRELVKQREEVERGSRKWRILTGEIAENEKAQFELHLEQAERTGPQAAIDFLKKEIARTGDATGALQRLIDKYRYLAALQGQLGPIFTSGIGGGRQGPGDGRAGGGPTEALTTYVVGERGPELLTMGVERGHVWSNDALRALAAAAGPDGGFARNPVAAGPSGIGPISISVDARGHDRPEAVGAAVKQGVADAMADVLREQSARLPVGTRS